MINTSARRDDCGSIDISFYKKRAERLRREAILDMAHTIRELILAWLHQRRAGVARRVLRP